MAGKIYQINPSKPEPKIIDKAAEVIHNSGVVIFPTWSLYGLAADAFDEKAIQKVFEIKKRKSDKPLLILIKNLNELSGLVTEIPYSAKKIINRFWPGRVTLVFNAKESISKLLTGGTGKIGIRLPEHPVALALLNRLSNPITGTSANLSDSPGCNTVKAIAPSIIDQTGLTLDSGVLHGGTGSTIVDVTCDPPLVLRQGEISIY